MLSCAMNLISFTSLLVFVSTTFASPVEERALPLSLRGYQQRLESPPDEQPYVDPVTGAQTPKSRILWGVGPKQADEGEWDWDESCQDQNDRAIITAAFKNTIMLAEKAFDHLQKLTDSLPQAPQSGKPNADNKDFIREHDPAFLQMFGGKDDQIAYIKETFNLVARRATLRDDRNQRGPDGLRFICDRDNKVKDVDGEKWCTTAQAMTLTYHRPNEPGTIEGKYQFTTSASITFCPPFFNEREFPALSERATQKEGQALEKVDCRERILLHEYMHLDWVRNMAPKEGFDVIGYLNAATAASRGWRLNKIVPDCYAWFAIYSYFNNHKNGCSDDVWPEGVKRPNK